MLACAFAQAWGADPEAAECDVSGSSVRQTAQCMDRLVMQKREVIERLYTASLARIPNSVDDQRSIRQQFQQEHAAWRKYVDEHCSFYAGVSEGASAWISLAELRCQINELDARIVFLQNIPWNPERY